MIKHLHFTPIFFKTHCNLLFKTMMKEHNDTVGCHRDAELSQGCKRGARRWPLPQVLTLPTFGALARTKPIFDPNFRFLLISAAVMFRNCIWRSKQSTRIRLCGHSRCTRRLQGNTDDSTGEQCSGLVTLDALITGRARRVSCTLRMRK